VNKIRHLAPAPRRRSARGRCSRRVVDPLRTLPAVANLPSSAKVQRVLGVTPRRLRPSRANRRFGSSFSAAGSRRRLTAARAISGAGARSSVRVRDHRPGIERLGIAFGLGTVVHGDFGVASNFCTVSTSAVSPQNGPSSPAEAAVVPAGVAGSIAGIGIQIGARSRSGVPVGGLEPVEALARGELGGAVK